MIILVFTILFYGIFSYFLYHVVGSISASVLASTLSPKFVWQLNYTVPSLVLAQLSLFHVGCHVVMLLINEIVDLDACICVMIVDEYPISYLMICKRN